MLGRSCHAGLVSVRASLAHGFARFEQIKHLVGELVATWGARASHASSRQNGAKGLLPLAGGLPGRSRFGSALTPRLVKCRRANPQKDASTASAGCGRRLPVLLCTVMPSRNLLSRFQDMQALLCFLDMGRGPQVATVARRQSKALDQPKDRGDHDQRQQGGRP